MRCVAYCQAESYPLNKIAEMFKQQGFKSKFYSNVLYIWDREETLNRKEVFIFNHGSLVTWNLKSQEERKVLAAILPLANVPLLNVEHDYFIFNYGEKTKISPHERFNTDVISLEEDDVQIKLAISYGLAQSVKLESYEASVRDTIAKNSSLPQELALYGRIALSGKAISKRMGEIFLERSSVNLRSEYLDMPEYFWEYPNMENYYLMTEKFLDIPHRVSSLNQRLDVLHELFNILTSQLQHRHSSMLETVIIILILIEVIMNVVHFHG
jgi:uncharacterized Rmd1/YagE family protein